MRWIVVFITLAIGVLGFFLLSSRENETTKETLKLTSTPKSPMPEVAFKNTLDASFNNTVYRIFFYEIPKDYSIKLIPNFFEKESGEKLALNNNCKAAINGGFYQDSGKPLGLFYSEGSQAGKLIRSNLVTWFFWQDNEGRQFIGKTPPSLD